MLDSPKYQVVSNQAGFPIYFPLDGFKDHLLGQCKVSLTPADKDVRPQANGSSTPHPTTILSGIFLGTQIGVFLKPSFCLWGLSKSQNCDGPLICLLQPHGKPLLPVSSDSYVHNHNLVFNGVPKPIQRFQKVVPIYGGDCPAQAFIYPSFDCVSSTPGE